MASWMTSKDDQLFHNLVKIELINCKLCEDIPILGHLRHLEVVKFVRLDNLKCIGPEFYGLDERIVRASRSTVAAPAPAVFPALKKLTISGMQELKEWSDVSSFPPASTSMMEFFPLLEELYISECPNLITIPGHLLSIQEIHISSEGVVFRKRVCRPSLTIEVAWDSKNVCTLIENLLETSRKSVRRLHIRKLDELCHLEKQLLNLASLEALTIEDCPNLMHISEETGAEFNRLTTLQELSIRRCDKLICLPKFLLQPTLVCLEICGCSNLMEVNPNELRNLTSLQTLKIRFCNLRWQRCWQEGQLCLTSLRKLVIGCFLEELDYFPWPEVGMAKAQNPFVSLESLTLLGWPKRKCLPDQLRHLTSLRKLEINYFDELEALPEWLGNFSSLESLTLICCHTLTSLPSLETFQLLRNLQTLDIIICPLLSERCKESGEEWHKIAHIPRLRKYDSCEISLPHGDFFKSY